MNATWICTITCTVNLILYLSYLSDKLPKPVVSKILVDPDYSFYGHLKSSQKFSKLQTYQAKGNPESAGADSHFERTSYTAMHVTKNRVK